jgi:hypothetical protein
MNFRFAMLMAAEHTSIPFIGACFPCRHPLIFLSDPVCFPLLLSLLPLSLKVQHDVSEVILTGQVTLVEISRGEIVSGHWTKIVKFESINACRMQ